MLKISRSSAAGQTTLRLAGRLAGEWVGELEKACAITCVERERVVLDFTDVIFVDHAGAALIRSLLAEGLSLLNCSPFIVEQLKPRSWEKNAEST